MVDNHIFVRERNTKLQNSRKDFNVLYSILTHWKPLHNINCAHLGTHPCWNSMVLYTNPDQYYWYQYSGPLYFWPILLVAVVYGLRNRIMLLQCRLQSTPYYVCLQLEFFDMVFNLFVYLFKISFHFAITNVFFLYAVESIRQML